MLQRPLIGLLVVMLLWSAGSFARAANPPNANPQPGDPPGTEALMRDYRAWFDKCDKNKDGVLDKSELAKAFRGVNAKPAAEPQQDAAKQIAMKTDKRPAKPKEYADTKFLQLVDQDKDGKVSREEFQGWARQMAAQAKQTADAQVAQIAQAAQAMQMLQAQALLAQLGSQSFGSRTPNGLRAQFGPQMGMSSGGHCGH
jgi:Ca2+-binding EF-hand superfamily protein